MKQGKWNCNGKNRRYIAGGRRLRTCTCLWDARMTKWYSILCRETDLQATRMNFSCCCFNTLSLLGKSGEKIGIWDHHAASPTPSHLNFNFGIRWPIFTKLGITWKRHFEVLKWRMIIHIAKALKFWALLDNVPVGTQLQMYQQHDGAVGSSAAP